MLACSVQAFILDFMADNDMWQSSRNDANRLNNANGNVSLFDKVPPHDEDAEMAVLGGMLMSKDAIGEVSQILETSDFYVPKHQTIYDAIINLFSGSQPVDVVLVANELLKDENLEKIGGADYLHSLVAFVPTAANALYYADIVHKNAILRNVIAAGTKIAPVSYTHLTLPTKRIV